MLLYKSYSISSVMVLLQLAIAHLEMPLIIVDLKFSQVEHSQAPETPLSLR